LPEGARLDDSGAIACLRFPLLERVTAVRHAVTTRLGGSSQSPYDSANMGLSVGDDPLNVVASRWRAAALVAPRGIHPVSVHQVHGVAAHLAESPGQPGVVAADADMVATNTPAVPLMVQAADCVPIVIIDPVHTAVAVVHAGWRGTALGAATSAVDTMHRFFGSAASDLLVAIGPAIGACCYEVDASVASQVAAACTDRTNVVHETFGSRPHVDLSAALHAQLLTSGVPSGQVALSRLCTACNPGLFYSHRGEGEPTGRFAALVCINT